MRLKLAPLLALSLLLPSAAQAETPDAFRVTSHVLHIEADKAEVCLAFSRPIAIDRDALAATIRLRKNNARVQITPRDLSVTPTELCVQGLNHRGAYRLALKDLRDKNGAPLAEAFDQSFTVPDRKPALNFDTTARAPDLPRFSKGQAATLALKAINVTSARLQLYRVADRNAFAAAWAQFAQASLVPSESLYFVKNSGQSVWQSDLAFSDAPNAAQSMPVSLPAEATQTPGFYFLAATPRVADAGPSLLAGFWFLVSDLRLSAVASPNGTHVFAAHAAAQAFPSVDVQLLAQDGRVLAEAKSDAEGTAVLNPKERQDVALVTGITAAGDVAIFDVKRRTESAFAPPPRDASLATDRPLYQPGATATVTLFARDEEGRPAATSGSSLKLLRPDQSFHSEQPVPDNKTAPLFLSVPLPVTEQTGVWTLLWQRNDGHVVARANLRLSPMASWPHLEATADRAALDEDGEVTVTVKATDEANNPLPWQSGQIVARPARPDFAAWKAYHFGTTTAAEDDTRGVRFITGADGTARVRLQAPTDASAVAFAAQLDHNATPTTLNLPVKTEAGWVGIRPIPDDRPFAENSVAAFNVIAVDANGKRRATNELSWQLYEEGRSFTWFPDEGRWNYQLLPQHRRIAGGLVTLAATGDALIRWPVTAGHYVLEIADQDGAPLAHYGFDAGWNLPAATEQKDERLVIAPLSAPLMPKQENVLHLKLAQSAMVSLLIGDDRVRQTLHRALKVGDNALAFTPDSDWGPQTQIRAEAMFSNGDSAHAALTLPLRHPEQELAFSLTPFPAAITGGTFTFPVTVTNLLGQQDTVINAQATPIMANGDTTMPSVTLTAQPVSRDGHAVLRFELPEFTGALQVTLTAQNDRQFGQKTLTLPAYPALDVTANIPQRLAIGDVLPVTFRVMNNVGIGGDFTATVTAPSGLERGGAVNKRLALRHGQGRTFDEVFTARAAVQGELKLEIVGPNNARATRAWPITVADDAPPLSRLTLHRIEGRQTVTLGAETSGKAALWISPAPLAETPRYVQSVLTSNPFTTAELAHALQAIRPWQTEIAASGLMSEHDLEALRSGWLRSLRLLQNDDGGFAALPGENASDMSATAEALTTLMNETPEPLTPAILWLQRKLENTWFDEAERPARAMAFLALSRVGRADLSALRYFADTSRDKTLAPQTEAEIALALALHHDDDATRFWLLRARGSLPVLLEAKNPAALPLLQKLAENQMVEPLDLIPSFEQAAAVPEGMAARLIAVATLQQRLGAWNIAIDGAERKRDGLHYMALPEKGSGVTLRNLADKPLFAVVVDPGAAAAAPKTEPDTTVQRQMYRLDGARIGNNETVTRDQIYLVTLHGVGKADKDASFVVTSPAGAGLQPLPAAGHDSKAIAALWPWLPQPLSDCDNAALTPTEASFAIKPAAAWRCVYLVKATRSGNFAVPPLTLRDLAHDDATTLPGRLRLQIR